MEIANAMTVWGFGKPCSIKWFCSSCRARTCIVCCPDHAARHHGGGAGDLIGIHMSQGMPALLSRQVKVTTLGYDWHRIHRKMVSRQKTIFLHRQPNNRRFKNQCKNCGDRIGTKSDYCSPSCKITEKPSGNNANLIQDLVNTNFADEAIRDMFCLGCLRAFSSAHCANHILHNHGVAEGGGAPVLVQIMEYEGWHLIPEDTFGQHVHLEHLKRMIVDGVWMVAVCRRQMPYTHGANSCANISCNESVDQAGEICSVECFCILVNQEEEDEEHQ